MSKGGGILGGPLSSTNSVMGDEKRGRGKLTAEEEDEEENKKDFSHLL